MPITTINRVIETKDFCALRQAQHPDNIHLNAELWELHSVNFSFKFREFASIMVFLCTRRCITMADELWMHAACNASVWNIFQLRVILGGGTGTHVNAFSVFLQCSDAACEFRFVHVADEPRATPAAGSECVWPTDFFACKNLYSSPVGIVGQYCLFCASILLCDIVVLDRYGYAIL